MKTLIPVLSLLIVVVPGAFAQKLKDSGAPKAVEGGKVAERAVGPARAYRAAPASDSTRAVAEAVIARSMPAEEVLAQVRKHLEGHKAVGIICIVEPLRDWLIDAPEAALEASLGLILYDLGLRYKKFAGIDTAWRAACPGVFPAKAVYAGRDSAAAEVAEGARALLQSKAAVPGKAAKAGKAAGAAVAEGEDADSVAELAARAAGRFADAEARAIPDALARLAGSAAAAARARAAAIDSMARIGAQAAQARKAMEAVEVFIAVGQEAQPAEVKRAAYEALGRLAAARWRGVWAPDATAVHQRLAHLLEEARPADSATHVHAGVLEHALSRFPKPPAK